MLLISRKLELYPNGDTEETKEHVSVYLNLNSAKNRNFLVNWSFTLQNQNGLERRHRSMERKGKEFIGGGYGLEKFISHEELSKYVKDSSRVTIICQVEILGL